MEMKLPSSDLRSDDGTPSQQPGPLEGVQSKSRPRRTSLLCSFLCLVNLWIQYENIFWCLQAMLSEKTLFRVLFRTWTLQKQILILTASSQVLLPTLLKKVSAALGRATSSAASHLTCSTWGRHWLAAHSPTLPPCRLSS